MLVQKDGSATEHKNIISCCKKVSAETNITNDIVVNILLNNIPFQRGLVTHEQKLEEMKTVRTARDEIAIGTDNWRSDEWEKGACCWSEAEAGPGVAQA